MMADGYTIEVEGAAPRDVPAGSGGAADAERALGQLRAIVSRPTVETAVQPYGDPTFRLCSERGSATTWPACRRRPTPLSTGRWGSPRLGTSSVHPGPSSTRARSPNSSPRVFASSSSTKKFASPARTSPFNLPGVVKLSGGGSVAQALLPDAGVAAVTTVPG